MSSHHKPKGDSGEVSRQPIEVIDSDRVKWMQDMKFAYKYKRRGNDIPRRDDLTQMLMDTLNISPSIERD